MKYFDVLPYPNRVSRILMLPKAKKRLVMASLSNLSKYLGIYDYWKSIIKNYGLKWERYSALDTVINILNSNLDDVQDWLKTVIQKLPKEYAIVEVFVALTGLRPSEACTSCNLISELSERNQLDQYLDSELMMLQHFRFKDLFLRRNKNAYISFISQDLLNLILEIKPKINYGNLHSKINRLGFSNQTKQLRKLNATILRDYLPKELIDLLQGRISESVFLKFYYKPFLKEIRNKVSKGTEPLQKELLQLLS